MKYIGTPAIGLRRIVSAFLRGSFYPAKLFQIVGVLSCILFWFTTCVLCSLDWRQMPPLLEACGSYEVDSNVGPQDPSIGDVSLGQVEENPAIRLSFETACLDSNHFCFPSTLLDSSSEDDEPEDPILEVPGSLSDASLDRGIFKLLGGRTVFCTLTLEEGIPDLSYLNSVNGIEENCSLFKGPSFQKKCSDFRTRQKSESTKSGYLDDAAENVEIYPPLLDWGQKYLHFPSLAFLTVVNRQKDSVLRVYEPFSTDMQFYSSNFSELLLEPGQAASICFVFLPRWLGLSSAYLILQTSSGGFLVQAKGFAVDSPYGIQPLAGVDISSDGWWSKNLSLFNPFDEVLYVEEVVACISFSSKNKFQTLDAKCSSTDNIWAHEKGGLFRAKEWLNVKTGQVGLTVMRPRGSWVLDPHSSETLIEVDFSSDLEGQLFGVFCMQLRRTSHDENDIIMIPLEAELDGHSAYDNSTDSVLANFEVLAPCDACENLSVAVSLRNSASQLLSVVKISEVTKSELFKIKYIEDLLLFPGSVTQVALVTFTQKLEPDLMNCRLLIQTNASISPHIEISFQEMMYAYSRCKLESSIRCNNHPDFKPHSLTTSSLSRNTGFSVQNKVLEMVKTDDHLLKNWKSHGTGAGMSVLDDQEIVFHVVQVGTNSSKWISVKNPSQQPVIMQLILNSEEIIDECKGLDGFLQPPLSSNLVNHKSSPPKYGFSLGKSTLTQAYVQPYGRVTFGPITFHPSSRCEWRSSALIRNNLSGVEWLSLRGFGGVRSLVLLEGSEPVQSLKFNLNLPIPLNISPANMSVRLEDASYACAQPSLKTVHAKNTGDLPLEVKRIDISGTECGLDGFIVQSCKRFFLEPGESRALLISYWASFSAANVQRDLEFTMSTGILVIPMEANIPMYMLNLCKKSIFWMRVRKTFAAVLLAGILLLVFCWIIPLAIAWGFQDYFFGKENSIASRKAAAKSSHSHLNQAKSKLSSCSTTDNLPSSFREVEFSIPGMVNGCANHGVLQRGLTSKLAKHASPNQEHDDTLLSNQKGKGVPLSLLSKTAADENSDLVKMSEPAILTVRIGKEKGKRRKRRKGAATGLTALFDVSSSQSGNSTPSSPLSPLASLTPNKTCVLYSDVDQTIVSRNPFTQVSGQHCDVSKRKGAEHAVPMNHSVLPTQELPTTPRKVSKAVLLPSATFPSISRPAPSIMNRDEFLIPSSLVAPHARAPGSKLHNEKKVEIKESAGIREEFTYDIWGEHLPGLHLIGTSREAPAMMSSAKGNNSYSFFVRGPQTLMENSLPKTVSGFDSEAN